MTEAVRLFDPGPPVHHGDSLHPQVAVRFPGGRGKWRHVRPFWTSVDTDLRPLVTGLWEAGVYTTESCQDRDGEVWLFLVDRKAERRFLRVLALAADRMAAPGRLDLSAWRTHDLRLRRADTFVAFPLDQLEEVTRRVMSFNRVRGRTEHVEASHVVRPRPR